MLSHPGALLGILVLAAGLRIAYLGRPSLFYDEVIVLKLATQPDPPALLRLLQEIDATRAPLHPLLLQAWVAVFGASTVAGRSFSVLCGLLSVILVDRIGRRAYGAQTGLWAALLFAISPMQVRYAQEVRMYALLVLETCIAWDLLLSFRESASRGRMVAYLATLVALGYTHPLGLFMAFALALGYFVTLPGSQLTPRQWLIIQLAAALAIAPWVIHYVDHPPEITIGRLPLKFLIGLPIGYIGGNRLSLPGFVALAAFGLLRWSPQSPRRLALERPHESLALLTWFAVPPLLLYGHSLVSSAPIFGPPRYTLFVGPAYLILVAHGLAKLPLLPRGVTAAVCVVLAASLLRTLVYSPSVKADWREASARIEAINRDAPIVYLTDEPKNLRQFVPLRHYLGPRARILMMTTALEHLAENPWSLGPSAWTVVEIRDGRPRAHAPSGWLKWYEPTSLAWTLPGVELIYYRLRRPAGSAEAGPTPAGGFADHLPGGDHR